MGRLSETFGNYRLTERLAFGGMAEVFLASVHGAAGFIKPVVIKRLHPKLSEDSEFVQMLIDEARITAQLIQSNICQVLDLGEVKGSYYIAMEFISGEDLRTLQDHCRRRQMELPLGAAIHLVAEMLAGLDYAHRKEGPDGQTLGIIHRDISPQNVLISYEGEVKVIDFGIAKARMRIVQTQAGIIKGKFRYMAPEQASGGQLDQRTDIFAAGVVLYELLRGSPHSVDLSDTEVLQKMRLAEFEPLVRFRPDLPPELDKIVRKALQRKPRNRYPRADEFRQALLRFMHQQGLIYGRSELAELMRQVFDEDRRRRRSGSVATAQRPGQAASDPSQLQARSPSSDSRPEPTSMLTHSVSAESARTGIVQQPAPPAAAAPASRWQAAAESIPPPQASPRPISRVVSGELVTDPTLEAASQPALPLSGRAAEGGAAPQPDQLTGVWAPRAADVERAEEVLATQRYQSAAFAPEDQATRAREVPFPAARQPAAASAATRAPEVAAVSGAGRAPGAVAGQAPQAAGQGPLERQARARSKGGRFSRAERSPYDPPPPRDISALPGAGGLAPTPSDAQPAAPRSPVMPQAPPRTRRWGTLIAGVIVGLAAGALVVGLQLYQASPTGSPAPAAAPAADASLAEPAEAAVPGGFSSALLHVRSKPSGAAIVYCGKRQDRATPATLEVRSGQSCLLELRRAGYQPYRQPVRPSAAQPTTVDATLQRRARALLAPVSAPPAKQPAAAASSGTLRVTSIQLGTVYIDNKPRGQTPRLTLQLAPGTYRVRVHFPVLDLTTPSREVFIDPGRTTSIHIDPK